MLYAVGAEVTVRTVEMHEMLDMRMPILPCSRPIVQTFTSPPQWISLGINTKSIVSTTWVSRSAHGFNKRSCHAQDKSTRIHVTWLSSSAPEDQNELLGLGRSYISRNDTASAVEAFRSAVKMNPHSAMALSELGRALVRDGKTDEGFSTLIAAFELDSLCPGLKDGFREFYQAGIKVNIQDLANLHGDAPHGFHYCC